MSSFAAQQQAQMYAFLAKHPPAPTAQPLPDLSPVFPKAGVKCIFLDEDHVVVMTYLGTTVRGHAFLAECNAYEKPRAVRIAMETMTLLWNHGLLFVFGLPRPWLGA